MTNNMILSGFLLAIGWFLSKVCVSFVVGFLNALLYSVWPWYRTIIDQWESRKTHTSGNH